LPFPDKWKPLPFARSLWQLRRLVKRHRIQLIHCNVQDVYPIGQWLSRLCRLPVVVSVHSLMARGFCSWAMGGSRQPERVFFISRSNRESCREAMEGVVPEARWRLLYNGLDMEQYRVDPEQGKAFRKEHGLGSGLLIGTACAIRAGKQLEHLFEVVSSLRVPGVRLIHAGRAIPGEEEYAKKALEQGKQVLGDRFLHLGWLTNVGGFYNALDLCVNASKEEACSISVLQAMACGAPVVGYPSVAVQEEVLPGGGEIVEQDRIGKLTEAVECWLCDPVKLSAARQEVRRHVEEHFDIRKIAGKLWDEYQSLCN
jgi:glycosyltransferase involved in cell wall biosynthesis